MKVSRSQVGFLQHTNDKMTLRGLTRITQTFFKDQFKQRKQH